MDGQANTAPELTGVDSLADFLSDTPEEESEEGKEATTEESTAEGDKETEETTGQDDAEATDEEAEAEKDAEPAPERKIAVKIKAEDGTETTEEVPEAELVKGYQRQADYTRKTQALAEREGQAVEFLKTKHDEIRNQYLSQAELARAAVLQIAGLKTEPEMAQLATSDPAAWVAENQRQRQIAAYLNHLEQQINGEKQKAAQERDQSFKQNLAAQAQKTWQVLEKEKIDKSTLTKIYSDVSTNYGYSNEELSNVYDARLVMMMKDATAYRALKAQKQVVTQKVEAAPKMPNRQVSPAQERKAKELNEKFRNGRAKLNDLASYLA